MNPEAGPAAARARRGRPSTGARERILDAALDVLKAEGYAGMTIAKVAARAGESKPLVVYHFGSKQGLVASASEVVAQTVTDAVLERVEGARTVEEVVRGIADGTDRILDEDERLARVYFDLAAVSVVEPDVRKAVVEVTGQWRAVIARLLGEAGLSPARSRVLTVMVMAGIQGLALERIERGKTAELRKAQDLFIRSAVSAAG